MSPSLISVDPRMPLSPAPMTYGPTAQMVLRLMITPLYSPYLITQLLVTASVSLQYDKLAD
jgi:hypothetical protein